MAAWGKDTVQTFPASAAPIVLPIVLDRCKLVSNDNEYLMNKTNNIDYNSGTFFFWEYFLVE
jgi:hypothetical protein